MKRIKRKFIRIPDWEFFRGVANDIISRGRYYMLNGFIAHSSVSVYMHSLKVAALSYYIAVKSGAKCDLKSLITGALLHDYYLYDWHDNKPFTFHGLKHHKIALKNALEDYELTKTAQNIIYTHMFPLTFWTVPWNVEARIVMRADKIVSTRETFKRDPQPKFA